MKRTTVMLPDDVDERLRLEARRRAVPIAEVIREAVELHLPTAEPGRPLAFFAISDNGPVDGAENVDDYVRAVVRRRHER